MLDAVFSFCFHKFMLMKTFKLVSDFFVWEIIVGLLFCWLINYFLTIYFCTAGFKDNALWDWNSLILACADGALYLNVSTVFLPERIAYKFEILLLLRKQWSPPKLQWITFNKIWFAAVNLFLPRIKITDFQMPDKMFDTIKY